MRHDSEYYSITRSGAMYHPTKIWYSCYGIPCILTDIPARYPIFFTYLIPYSSLGVMILKIQ